MKGQHEQYDEAGARRLEQCWRRDGRAVWAEVLEVECLTAGASPGGATPSS